MSQLQKLTLAVPKKTALRAKSYAKHHKTSVSSLVTRLFGSIDAIETGKKDLPTAAITRSSLGIISLPKKKKADLITEALAEKYFPK